MRLNYLLPLFLAACTYGPPDDSEILIPAALIAEIGNGAVDVRALQEAPSIAGLVAQNGGFGLMRDDGYGLWVKLDGTAEFHSINDFGNRVQRTQLTRFQENTICVQETQTWSGACIQIDLHDGNLHCRIQYGNGAERWSDECWVVRERWL